jgi:hypothetical protein
MYDTCVWRGVPLWPVIISPLKQLRLAGEHPLDISEVQGVELRTEHLADVPAMDLFRCEPEELDERTVGDAVAHARVPIADQRRQRIHGSVDVSPPRGCRIFSGRGAPLGA